MTFTVTADWLIFENGEREPQDEPKLKFEAVKQMDEEEQKSFAPILGARILKHQRSACWAEPGSARYWRVATR